MSKRSLNDLREMLCKELDEIARKVEMNAGDLETVHKLTDTIKNIDKIEMLEDGEYSQRGSYRSGGSSRNGGGNSNSYGRSNSYASRGGEHYVRGHYSRDGRGGGYSREDGREHMMMELENLMEDAETEQERECLRRCMNQLERA